jgi:hypothetical protein
VAAPSGTTRVQRRRHSPPTAANRRLCKAPIWPRMLFKYILLGDLRLGEPAAHRDTFNQRVAGSNPAGFTFDFEGVFVPSPRRLRALRGGRTYPMNRDVFLSIPQSWGLTSLMSSFAAHACMSCRRRAAAIRSGN